MSHYSLDVDPDGVRAAANRVRRAGRELSDQADDVQGTADGWSAGWRGDAATAAAVECAGLSTLLGRGSQALEHATGRLDGLADDYARALDVQLPALERRRDAALAAHAAAVATASRNFRDEVAGAGPAEHAAVVADAERSRGYALAAAGSEQAMALRAVDAAYDQLVEDLRASTRATGAALAADPPVPVPPLSSALYSYGGLAGGLLGTLSNNGLDPATALADLLPMSALVSQLEDPPGSLVELTALLEQARATGLPPAQYGQTLQAFWEHSALEAAGIDLATWNPALGATANRATIEAVYTYYAALYLDDPDLQWAGMAAMIGPSFAGGFYDLALLRELGVAAGSLPPSLRRRLPPGFSELAHLSAAEIAFYERTLLQMQQDIFIDLAPAHQAYATGGLPAIEELYAAEVLTAEQRDAWRQIASGAPERVASGNAAHLEREQWDVIADEYDEMRARFPTGPAVTYAMTFVGAPSIDGARSYPDVFPLTVGIESPGIQRVPFVGWDNPLQVRTEIETPFPDGNISVDHQRWALIDQDTLPAFRRLLAQEPDEVEQVLSTPVGERIEDWRLSARWDEVLAQLGDWDARVEQ